MAARTQDDLKREEQKMKVYGIRTHPAFNVWMTRTSINYLVDACNVFGISGTSDYDETQMFLNGTAMLNYIGEHIFIFGQDNVDQLEDLDHKEENRW